MVSVRWRLSELYLGTKAEAHQIRFEKLDQNSPHKSNKMQEASVQALVEIQLSMENFEISKS